MSWDLLHAVNQRHGTHGFTSLPKEGVLRIFSPWKIRQLRPGLNPRTWVPKATALTPRPPKPPTAVLGDVDLHWARILLSFLSTFLAVASPNILKLSYTNNTFLSSCNFCIHLNYFSHPENGGCMFLSYVETCNHRIAQKHKRRPLPGQPSWKPDNNKWRSKSETDENSWRKCT
jgi:hypothetical protein